MSTFHLSRRSVLAGTAAVAAVVSLPLIPGQAGAVTPAKGGYRWRNVVQGGTGADRYPSTITSGWTSGNR